MCSSLLLNITYLLFLFWDMVGEALLFVEILEIRQNYLFKFKLDKKSDPYQDLTFSEVRARPQ